MVLSKTYLLKHGQNWTSTSNFVHVFVLQYESNLEIGNTFYKTVVFTFYLILKSMGLVKCFI